MIQVNALPPRPILILPLRKGGTVAVASLQCDPDEAQGRRRAIQERISRRVLLRKGIGGFAMSAVAVLSIRVPAAADDYGITIKTLQFGYEREMTAYRRYVAYSRQARAERYRGISYLFNAIASSELIHAQNFDRVLSRLGVEIAQFQPLEPTVADTKANLIDAAAKELSSIDVVYPDILKQLEVEKYRDAIVNATYAWESHRQHRGIIQKIEEYTADHFEEVARTIDEKAGAYYVCEICGSTVNEIPLDACPICGLPSTHYRKIEFFLL
jgi:rubrerythrin